MAIIEFGSAPDRSLHVDHFGLSIGSTSVGLPMSCTTETVLERYLDLLRLLERKAVSRAEHATADLEVLAEATHLSVDAVTIRLASIAA